MKRYGAVIAVVVLMVGVRFSAAQLTLGGDLNPACINMRIVEDICWTSGVIPVPYPCAHLSFWMPKWIVDTQAGYANLGGQHFHFHDATVKPVTQGFAINDPCRGCLVPTLNAVVSHFYDSRSDGDWHAAQSTAAMPLPIDLMRVGIWGRAYPRVGYVTHPSPASASGLAATRAFNIARYPFDLWPDAGNYRLNGCRLPDCGPLLPNALPPQVGPLPCLNLERPVRHGCHNAGLDLRSVFDRASANGAYTWVVWKRKRCTLPMPLQACAYQLEGLSKNNRCFNVSTAGWGGGG